jgi:hypothetical protein
MLLSVIQNLLLTIPIEALGDEKLITNRTVIVFLVGFFLLLVIVLVMYRNWKKELDKKQGK